MSAVERQSRYDLRIYFQESMQNCIFIFWFYWYLKRNFICCFLLRNLFIDYTFLQNNYGPKIYRLRCSYTIIIIYIVIHIIYYHCQTITTFCTSITPSLVSNSTAKSSTAVPRDSNITSSTTIQCIDKNIHINVPVYTSTTIPPVSTIISYNMNRHTHTHTDDPVPNIAPIASDNISESTSELIMSINPRLLLISGDVIVHSVPTGSYNKSQKEIHIPHICIFDIKEKLSYHNYGHGNERATRMNNSRFLIYILLYFLCLHLKHVHNIHTDPSDSLSYNYNYYDDIISITNTNTYVLFTI